MPLVYCPDCRAEVSDRAAACPHCGYPIAGSPPVPVKPARLPKPRSYITTRFALGFTAAAALLGMMTMGFGIEGEEGGVAFTAFAIWGSSLVVWWKARRAARAAALPGVAEIESLIEKRTQGLEERLRGQLGDGGDRRIMELEERMEFMERLLTKVRDDQIGPG